MNIDHILQGHHLVYLTTFGSKLYGTSSSSSDTDYKGIFIPTLDSLILGNAPDTLSSASTTSKNTSTDIDVELWSLHKFLNLLLKGDTGAIDLLFSMFNKSMHITPPPSYITDNYSKLISTNSHAYIGYCMQQAKRYGIKGSRYGDLLELDKFLHTFDFNMDIKSSFPIHKIADQFPKLKYISFITKDKQSFISILGKLHHDTVSIQSLHNRIKHDLNQYGERVKASTDGVDYKALSHAYRVLLQFKELITTGFIKFPLTYADSITKIKYDKPQLEDVLSLISTELNSLPKLIEASSLPTSIDKSLINSILLSAYHTNYKEAN